MTEISFEHFDPEYELGNLDINGKPIKPRKKPGRKPNPPSPAQRKAQNRAAQRAFRERKRREMKDAETNIKKCMYMRDQAIKEAKQLSQKVKELRYENNFLKGQVLTLKICCIANRVDVPKFWDTGMRDKMGSDITTLSQTKDIPQSLEFFLTSSKNIITMTAEDLAPYDSPSQPLSPEIPVYPPPPQSIDSTILSNMSYHDAASPNSTNTYPMPTATTSSTTTATTSDPFSGMVDPILSQSPLNQNAQFYDHNNFGSLDPTAAQLDPNYLQHLLQPDVISEIMDQMKEIPSELWLSMIPPAVSSLIPPEIRSFLNQPHEVDLFQQIQAMDLDPTTISTMASEFISHQQQQQQQQQPPQQQQQQPQPQQQQPLNTPPTSTVEAEDLSSEFKPEIPKEDDFWMDIKNPSSPTAVSNKVYVAGPIPPLEAVTRMRTMRDQNDNRYLLTPTELQRNVPHDPRIDLIPGPTMRDYMIIFQDFYDANELFNLLLESAMFIGGELGNPDCWYVPPIFIRKYWFICPTYRPTRPDNSVELAIFFAKKMINALKRRREMYIMREKYPDVFLAPSEDSDEDSDDCEMDHETQEEHDTRIDMLVINNINKEIPRIISPNVFTV